MILYEGNTGMPYEVPTSEIENFIRRGFRTTAPGRPTPPPVAAPVAIPGNPALIRVNSASLKDLCTLPEVGIATAKLVRDHRPYANVEDLLAKVPDIDWLAINPRLDYTAADAAH